MHDSSCRILCAFGKCGWVPPSRWNIFYGIMAGIFFASNECCPKWMPAMNPYSLLSHRPYQTVVVRFVFLARDLFFPSAIICGYVCWSTSSKQHPSTNQTKTYSPWHLTSMLVESPTPKTNSSHIMSIYAKVPTVKDPINFICMRLLRLDHHYPHRPNGNGDYASSASAWYCSLVQLW